MPDRETPGPHPLQLGQVLYAVQDSTLIYAPKGSSTARFQRVSFDGTSEKPEPVVHPAIDIGPMDEIRSARAVTHWAGGRQEVALLTKSGVFYITMQDKAEAIEKVQGGEGAVFVIGLDPDVPDKRVLALLANDGSGYSVVRVDAREDGSGSSPPWRLPAVVKGTALAAELVRRDKSAILVLVMLTDDGSLEVNAVAWSDLPRATSQCVSTVTLGSVSKDEAAQVNATVAQMRFRSSDQQLALTWADTNAAPHIALVGWGDDRKFSVLATTTPDIAFASPERPVYRVAAADLLGRGVDQLVVAYPATHNKQRRVEGCAALMFFELDDEGSTSRLLRSTKYRSDYTVANVDDQPLTSYDLHLGAGLFGSCLGIQVIGCGASLADLMDGQASVLCGFVEVNANTGGLPAMPPDGSVAHISAAKTPGNLLARMNPESSMLAFPSDMGGRSVILGAPRYERKAACKQILAIIQAPPFDTRTVAASGQPSVSISWTSGKNDSTGVNSDDSYTTTKDLSVHMAVGSFFNLTTAMHNSYGESFSKVNDITNSTNIQFHASFSNDDYLLLLETSYGVWRYPVLSNSDQMEAVSSGNDAPPEVLVIIPHDRSPSTMWEPARTFAYRPRSELGMLLSYVFVEPEHFSEENLLFKRQGSSVGTDTVTVSYDKSDMTSIGVSKHLSVVNSLSGHLGVSAGTELFEELPITFGINVGMSSTDARSKIETTHITNHTAMSVTVGFGQVKDKKHEFAFTPLIYQHGELGCLVLTWDVPLPSGGAWTPDAVEEDGRLTSPQVCMLRVEPDTDDPVKKQFSRSFFFEKRADDKVDISVEIFNNGILNAEDVSCDFYLGRPEKAYSKELKKKIVRLPETKLGTVKMQGILPGARRSTIRLPDQALPPNSYVTVQLYSGDLTNDDSVFYGLYTPRASA
ncbi:MAG TPA: hypothetical protein VHJ78_03825 [Actinomycetota bacterium]|nr:hypothetical protein [Actinomycetota bacterium]